eukprot:scaffold132997_cov60-Phaeocystis_antarctica.AAC.3
MDRASSGHDHHDYARAAQHQAQLPSAHVASFVVEEETRHDRAHVERAVLDRQRHGAGDAHDQHEPEYAFAPRLDPGDEHGREGPHAAVCHRLVEAQGPRVEEDHQAREPSGRLPRCRQRRVGANGRGGGAAASVTDLEEDDEHQRGGDDGEGGPQIDAAAVRQQGLDLCWRELSGYATRRACLGLRLRARARVRARARFRARARLRARARVSGYLALSLTRRACRADAGSEQHEA